MSYTALFTLLAALVIVGAQRPFYAGYRPIGYPELESDTVVPSRYEEDAPVPIETKGDKNLINNIESMPIDKRPFWYLNWQQYEDFRQRPQTWPLRPSNILEP